MGNLLYFIGVDKETTIFFSNESEVYFLLDRIIEKHFDSKTVDLFREFEEFSITDISKVYILYFELKIELLKSIDHGKYIFVNELEYIDYISRYKRTIAHERDKKSLFIRSCIKLCSSIHKYIMDKRELKFRVRKSNKLMDTNENGSN